MTRSEKTNKVDDGPSFLAGPKPAAPIPRYEPGSDANLRNRLRGTTSGKATGTERDEAQYMPDAADLNIAGIEGKIDRKKANVATKMVDNDPDQALRVIRNWMLGA
ncbi:hypothetical protein [Thalassospira sp.]|uniref:hypothetical protein n=1 Tax=Thalassospira sp. TaxID=1912094 RepID=UPI003AA9D90F